MEEIFDYPEALFEDFDALTLVLSLEKEYRKYFLNGFSIWQYIKGDMFRRLGIYVGYGLCYEASAAIMLCLKEYKTRLTFANCLWDKETGERVNHAFVEIYFQDEWWVIDPVWTSVAMPIRRSVHFSALNVRIIRWIFHDEWWSLNFVCNFYRQMKSPENKSFSQLILFRKTSNNDRMVFERNTFDWEPVLTFSTFGEEYPVSQRVLCEFFARPKRLAPKGKTYRRIKLLIKTMNRALDEVDELYERTGQQSSIKIINYKKYEIRANPSA